MSSDHRKLLKLKEFAELVNQPYQPSSDENLNYIGLEHIEQQTLRLNGIGNSSDVISQKHKFKAGDILFGKLRPYFRKVVRPSFNGVCSTDIWVVRAKPGFDQSFLFYFLANQRFIDACNSSSSGTRMPRADWNHLSETLWELPSLPEQKSIAEILSALDDKIELNRQTNATLEAIAQAIFKEWFVDFNYPGATGEMVDSELGPIPKGWQVVNINSLSQVIYGAPFASSLFTKDSIGRPLIRIRDLPNEQPSAYTIEVHPKGYLAKPGDILVGMDGEFRAYLWGGDDSWVNQRICVFKPVIEIPSPFLYFSIIEPLAKVEATETATTVIHLGKNDIDLFRFALPSIEVLRDFGNITEPIFEKIIINKKESRILSTTRDILLTRLMTGKVEI